MLSIFSVIFYYRAQHIVGQNFSDYCSDFEQKPVKRNFYLNNQCGNLVERISKPFIMKFSLQIV